MSLASPSSDASGFPAVQAASRPVVTAVAAIVVLVLAGWGALLFEALRAGGGPDALVAAICRPVALSGAGAADIVLRLSASAGLWALMSVAMMLPTAVPMVLAYADLAARREAEGLASGGPLPLVAGYVAVWAVASAAAAVAQAAVAGLVGPLALPPAALTVLSGAAVGAAGLYQFSEWKQRCLLSCRHPLPALEAQGAAGLGAVFRLGVSQGVACLGCCGAMMGMMAAVGAMNLAWMAGFALLMTVEKLTSSARLPQAVGVALILAGAALAASAVGVAPILAWLSR